MIYQKAWKKTMKWAERNKFVDFTLWFRAFYVKVIVVIFTEQEKNNVETISCGITKNRYEGV